MKNKIYWKEAVKLLKNNMSISEYEVYFDNEKIEALDVILLGSNDIDVPEELIYYDYDTIDYSDIPAMTDEDLEHCITGKFQRHGIIIISPKEAIRVIKKGYKIPEICQIEFDNEKIKLSDAELLRKNNIEVPENSIIYDEKID